MGMGWWRESTGPVAECTDREERLSLVLLNCARDLAAVFVSGVDWTLAMV